MLDAKTAVLARLVQSIAGTDGAFCRTLVVGCGKGFEAVDLADLLHCHVDAIDVYDRVCVSHPQVDFHVMDARKMTFPDASFDFVYSFHAMEHIPEPERAIGEIRRVLTDRGLFCIGTPNKNRVFHNVGCREGTIRRKLMSNVNDWKMRLKGQFRNECGAHAGFTLSELEALCHPIGVTTPVSRRYYDLLYPRYARQVALIDWLHLAKWIFPSHYLVGRKST